MCSLFFLVFPSTLLSDAFCSIRVTRSQFAWQLYALGCWMNRAAPALTDRAFLPSHYSAPSTLTTTLLHVFSTTSFSLTVVFIAIVVRRDASRSIRAAARDTRTPCYPRRNAIFASIVERVVLYSRRRQEKCRSRESSKSEAEVATTT